MLEGRHVILRLMTEKDVEEFVALDQNLAERGAYLGVRLRSLAEVRKKFNENGWWGEDEGVLLITDKAGRLLGAIGFFRSAPYAVGYEVGYGLFRAADRGHGYMSEALRLFAAYLFELKPIPELHVGVTVGNAPSRRVAEKCGFQFVGTLRHFGFARGRYDDIELFQLLRADCPPLADALRA